VFTPNQIQITAGTYSLIVTDTNACTLNKFITLSEPLKLVSAFEHSNYNGYGVKCNADTNGYAAVSVHGGILPYTINWSNNQTGAQLTNVGLGSYIYEVMDLNGCTTKDTVVITQPEIMELSSSTSTYNGYGVKCYGDTNGTVDLSVVGGVSPYTYSWNNGSTSQDLTSISLGDYTVTVVDLNQCVSNLNVLITEPPVMSLTTLLSNYNGFNLKCFNDGSGSVDLEVNGGVSNYTYSWSNGSINQDQSGLQAGNYSVLISDLNGCKLFGSVKLVQPDTLDMILIAHEYAGGFHISCNGLSDGSINSNVSGGTGLYTYSWSGNGINGNASSISGLMDGTYNLYINDNNACAINRQIKLSQPTPLVSSITTIDAYCIGNTGSIDLSVEGGVTPYTYSWSNGANTQDLSDIPSATYTVDIRDANACIKTQTILLNAVSNLTATGVVKDVKCYNAKDGSISLVANGTPPFIYFWNNGASTSTISQLSGGIYSVVITDYNGCSNSYTYTVSENTQIIVDSVISLYNGIYNISTYAANDGFIELTTSGGVFPYNYIWSNDETTSEINNLIAGTYVVQVTDAVGCKVNKRYKLIQPYILEMPNGYTPNNDGFNDAFVVHGIEAFPENNITVYNRWGNIVYQKDGYNNEWRGINTSGDNLPDGTYFVILDLNGGEKVLKGYVDLRRK
jgi:gliding motility-associated-like protein